MVHVGVDLHKRSAQVAVIEESGELKEFTVPTEMVKVQEVFGALGRPAHVAVEATRSWYWFVDLLQRSGTRRSCCATAGAWCGCAHLFEERFASVGGQAQPPVSLHSLGG